MHPPLPVNPYFKMASEVVTLWYLSQYTTIPIPHILDMILHRRTPFDSSGFL